MQEINRPELPYRRLFDTVQDGRLIPGATTVTIEDVKPHLMEISGYSGEEVVEKEPCKIGAFKDLEASPNVFEALQVNEVICHEALPKSEALLLHEQSIRDQLTGLFNRRYMEETLERELRRALDKKNHSASSC